MGEFKKFNLWLVNVNDFFYNVIYVDGEMKKEFVGFGVE